MSAIVTSTRPQNPPMHRTPIGSRPKPDREQGERNPGWGHWMVYARRRRLVFFLLVGISTYFACAMMQQILSEPHMTGLKWGIMAVFAVLFFWLASNFWVAFFGFLTLAGGRDRFNPRERIAHSTEPVAADVRTAVVMPVYNEDVKAVFDRIQSMVMSVRNAGGGDAFHFFILSDSDDPEKMQDEEAAWASACDRLDGYGKIFYRRRQIRCKKKHGNVMDFCRRWGRDYTYMVVLDADSLMSGDLLRQLVRIMEVSPDMGILQTVPKAIHQETLFGRIEQFASHLYGPLYIAGLHFLQLGDAAFWGHNAIVRLAPYMKYCSLPRLSGRAPFGGEILSHDFIESAFMRRAGYGVWTAYDMEESYEELPANLLQALKRDRRWCLGNLQHLRLLATPGLSWGHRMLLVNGNLYYLSSVLWLMLLVLATLNGVTEGFYMPVYFTAFQENLFPDWPVQHRELSLALLGLTALFLLGSKLFSCFHTTLITRNAGQFGGLGRMVAGMAGELLFSSLVAPAKMLFHCYVIAKGLLGLQKENWQTQRSSEGLALSTAWQMQRNVTLIGLLWGGAVYLLNPTIFWWLSVVLIPMVLAAPFTALTSWVSIGEALRRRGFFLTPDEQNPPVESLWFQGRLSWT